MNDSREKGMRCITLVNEPIFVSIDALRRIFTNIEE